LDVMPYNFGFYREVQGIFSKRRTLYMTGNKRLGGCLNVIWEREMEMQRL
jgi:hypothetical protein